MYPDFEKDVYRPSSRIVFRPKAKQLVFQQPRDLSLACTSSSRSWYGADRIVTASFCQVTDITRPHALMITTAVFDTKPYDREALQKAQPTMASNGTSSTFASR